jgi:predicted branched-subunit amino acid permease
MCHEPRIRDGIRAGLPLVLPMLAIGMSFGVLATPVIGGLAASVMSTVVFAGSAQAAAVGVLGAGGSAVAAILPGVLLNLRFLPMSLAVATSMRGSRRRRAVEAQTIVDASFVLAARDGGFDRHILVGSWFPQAVGWIGGTLIGVLIGDALPDPATLGIDAIFPAFFLCLLAGEVRGAQSSRRPLVVIALAAAITLALLPIAPAGVPVIAASGAAGAAAPMTPRTWVVIGVLAVLTVAIKAAGPVVLGTRSPSPRMLGVIALLSPALIASLIVYQTVGGHPTGVTVDARVVGLLAAAAAIAARLPMIAVIALAALAAALARLVA